jgi:hypothetical protein
MLFFRQEMHLCMATQRIEQLKGFSRFERCTSVWNNFEKPLGYSQKPHRISLAKNIRTLLLWDSPTFFREQLNIHLINSPKIQANSLTQ